MIALSSPHLRRQAFTLIELLVVISIIALLVGILLPALSQARRQARSLACATKLQQISRAMATYINDFDGFYPPTRRVNDTVSAQLSWEDKLGVGGYDGRSLGSFTAPPQFVGVLDAPLYVCPLDDFARAPLFGNPASIVPRTYSLNFRRRAGVGQFDQENMSNPSNTNPGVVGLALSLRVDDVTKSSRTILATEDLKIVVTGGTGLARNVLGGGNFGETIPFVHDPAGGTATAPRSVVHHQQGVEGPAGTARAGYTPNYLFVDSHVENLDTEVPLEDARGPFDYRDSMWDGVQ